MAVAHFCAAQLVALLHHLDINCQPPYAASPTRSATDVGCSKENSAVCKRKAIYKKTPEINRRAFDLSKIIKPPAAKYNCQAVFKSTANQKASKTVLFFRINNFNITVISVNSNRSNTCFPLRLGFIAGRFAELLGIHFCNAFQKLDRA